MGRRNGSHTGAAKPLTAVAGRTVDAHSVNEAGSMRLANSKTVRTIGRKN